MSHGLANNVAILRRWAAHHDGALPSDWAAFAQSDLQTAVKIKAADPELVTLLDGTAGAGLRADAISGRLSPIPPDPEKRRQQEHQQRIQQLEAAAVGGVGPDGRETAPNPEAQIALKALAPKRYEQLKAKHAPTPAPEQKRMQELQRQHQQAEARAASVAHNNAQQRYQHFANGGQI